jgi:hypothetical protein
MKLFVLALFSVCSLMASAQKTFHDPNAEVRTVNGFHAIHVSGAIDLYLTQSAEEGVAVSAKDRDDVQYIKTEVENGVLKIFFNKGDKWWPKNRKLKAYVSVVSLDELKASGASDVHVQGTVSLENLNVQFSGASDLDGKLVVTNFLSLNLSGASDASIRGSARDLKIDVSGASDVKGYEFRASTCTISASGASNVRISVDKEMTVQASGASSVNYKGEAVIRNVSTSGASNISRKS